MILPKVIVILQCTYTSNLYCTSSMNIIVNCQFYLNEAMRKLESNEDLADLLDK